MSSGSSSDRSAGGSKAYDFAADDVLRFYDPDQNPRSEAPNKRPISKEFREFGLWKSLMDDNNPQEEPGSQDVIAAVEKSMKKYTDTLMHFLEGISGRLSQLELYCYGLESNIGELRSDLNFDHDESNQKLESFEKHIQEVHRSVQILEDRQELSDAQKELTKLQLSQKESSSVQPARQAEDMVTLSTSGTNKSKTSSDAQNLQLSLALPHQPTVPFQPPPPSSLPLQQPAQGPSQPVAYYPQHNQVLHQVPAQSAQIQDPHIKPEEQFANQRPQVLDPARQPPQTQPPVSQPGAHPYASHQQQWPQQAQQSQPVPPATVRLQMPPVYPPYPPQPGNLPPESFPSSMPMQAPFSVQVAGSRNETGSYSYGAPSMTVVPSAHYHNPVTQPQPQPSTGQDGFGPGAGEVGYLSMGPHRSQSNTLGCMMYEGGGAPPLHPPHYAQGGTYLQQPPSSNAGRARPSPPHMTCSTPCSELMEKALSMGFPREQAATALRRMEESGQPMDFNTLLDRLNSVPQRAW